MNWNTSARIMLGAALLFLQAQTPAADPLAPMKNGDRVPDVRVRTEEGREVGLRDLVSQKPTVLIFYRGGWCPYCTRHLQALTGIEKEVASSGAQLVAISMDQPSKLKETPERAKLGFQLLSDSDAHAAKAFGIAFTVEPELVQKYKESYKIDIEAASGRKHHILPHPAVFVADTGGVIRFAHVNPDYTSRMDPQEVLAAVRSSDR